jgi:hypothetical protein
MIGHQLSSYPVFAFPEDEETAVVHFDQAIELYVAILGSMLL